IDAGVTQACFQMLRMRRRRVEREEAGTLVPSPRARDLPSPRSQAFGGICGKREDMLLNAPRSKAEQDLDRGVEAPDAGKILERRFEPRGARSISGQVVVEMRLAFLDAVIADMGRPQSVE